MKAAFGYLRTSGQSQIDNDGFPRQRAAIERFAAAAGYRVIRWFEDEAVSGTTASEDRPAFSEMMLMCGVATTQVILVESSDRLARDLMVSELICNEARKAKIQIIEAAAGNDLTDSSDAHRVLLRQFLGMMAEFNKSQLVQRLRVARQRKRVETGLPCGGPRRTLDGEALELILRLHDELGQGWQEIAVGLNRRKIPTPRGGPWWERNHVHKLYKLHMQRACLAANPKRGAHRELLDGLPV